jgi:hypothetical protein
MQPLLVSQDNAWSSCSLAELLPDIFRDLEAEILY